jgi:glutaminyl-tRNA synthetase
METKDKPSEKTLTAEEGTKPAVTNFIRSIIDRDLESGKHSGIVTRFPPEPNGYLHIGHAKSICLNFGLARDYKGRCHLRFDDTNPVKEDVEYVDSILADVRWLGFDWAEHLYYASDYFDKLYEFAEYLINEGKAFVCDLSLDELREYRGTLTVPGKNSPYRNRSRDENLDLFRRMKAGEFPEGSRSLRAKIDMASPNLNMRDPVIYRIRRLIITVQAAIGRFIPCMITLIAFQTPWKGSPTLSVPWSLRITVPFMTGYWINFRFPVILSKSNLPG